MAQHDYNIANQTFPNTRTDINNALSAVASNNSGTAAPSTTFANQWFYETDTNKLQIRNEDNDAFIQILELDQSNDKLIGLADSIAIATTGGVTITVADNTDTLSLISTDDDANVGPVLRLFRNSASPADNDVLGNVIFAGEDSAGNETDFLRLDVQASDKTNGAEDVQLRIMGMLASAETEFIRLNPSGFIFNEGGANLNFRIESNGEENVFFVDGGNNSIGVGTNSPALSSGRGIVVNGQSSVARVELRNDTSGAAATDGMFLTYSGSDAFVGNREAGTVQFWNNAAERMRINSAGEVGIGLSSFDSQLTVQRSTAGGSYSIFGIHSASSGTVRILRGSFNAQAPDDRTSVFITMGDSSATRFNVHADGDVDNHDNFYGQISDVRIKSNITDANSQWDDVKAMKFRNFERKDDIAQYGDGKKVQLGVVAQELETISPGLVRETEPTADDIKMSSEFGTLFTADDAETKDGNDAILYVAEDEEVINGEYKVGDVKIPATHSAKVGDIKSTTGEKVKAVAYSVLYIKAAKALQEAMERIEVLESKIN